MNAGGSAPGTARRKSGDGGERITLAALLDGIHAMVGFGEQAFKEYSTVVEVAVVNHA